MAPKTVNSLWSTFGFLTKVRYGGVLGKLSAIGIVFFLTLCVVVIVGRDSRILLGAILLAAVFGLVFLVIKVEAIFKSNPEMATLEGTEIIRYRQVELKSKNHDAVRVIELTTDPELPQPTTTAQIATFSQNEEAE